MSNDLELLSKKTYDLSVSLPTLDVDLTLVGTANINGKGNSLDNIITGNSGNNTLDGGGGTDVLKGGAGNDTYIVDNAEVSVVELLGAGTDKVISSIDYKLTDNVDNLTLTGDKAVTATGNILANIITGNDLDNTINAGTAGLDTLIGGKGDDTYIIDHAGVKITEATGEGTGSDLVQSTVSYTLDANVENLTLTGTAAVNGTGNALDNSITGNSGNNTLDGGLTGADVLAGGLGNDTYVVSHTGMTVTENDAEGTDTVMAGVTYTLGANLEKLTLTGTGNINGTGNSLVNVITGNAGNNTLDGQGGADTLVGGAGNDTYIVNETGVTLTELLAGGTDTVKINASTTLAANFENLILTGTALSGTGNTLSNVITGNDEDNTLNAGTAGMDTLIGGSGDDSYVIDHLGVKITEEDNSDIDFVQSTVSYTLDANVENLTITGAAISGVGNVSDNTITGNAANNTLDGGSSGDDLLTGDTGNDTYIISHKGITVIEKSGEGTDLVQAGISYTLGDNLENLTLTGTGNIDGIGNSAANIITGNAGNNTLDGQGGADALIGGLGDDTYIVYNAGVTLTEAAGAGTDTIKTNVSTTLAANFENLILTDDAANGTGNVLNNTITGTIKANTLNGGTAGTDMLIGGEGDDVYIVDHLGVKITELDGDRTGTDFVQSTVSYTLDANVENLTITGTAVSGIGNASDNTITGNALANTLDGGSAGTDALIGGAGNDTYVISHSDVTITEKASEGVDTVQANATYTLGSNLENLTLTGTGNIDGTGNSVVNIITGNAGKNTLDGQGGADILTGGKGDDTYVVGNTGIVINEIAGEGTDTVQSAITYTLGATLENLTLTGSSDINGTGNIAVNTITGNAGKNTLDGVSGADTLIGGKGDDKYIVSVAGVTVTENEDEGVDLVQSAVTYTLGANVENLTIIGAAIGATGNALDNVITGNAANNTLDGGSAGTDTLIGGAGNDTYVISHSGITITEKDKEGTDTVQAGASYTLGSYLENLTLTGTGDIDGIGNSLVNTITGNAGKNTLDGQGGLDTLIGGKGDDTYVVGNLGVVVTELASEGTDTVQAGITYALGANLENLTLTGTGDINGTGNAAVNTITGNAGKNTLDGGGGLDTLIGGKGNDTYLVNVSGVTITENEGEGTDTVQSSATYTLGSNLENLTITGTAVGATGNDLDNVITGNAANNTLDGGSAGTDVLVGGAGNDTYLVSHSTVTITEAAAGGTDTVQAGASYTLGVNLENLILTGTDDINGTGNTAANVITGNAGKNTLDGGGGADSLVGGKGDDTYIVGAAGTVITEATGEGTDTVKSSVSYSLGANLENLILTGTAALTATGNSLDGVTLTANDGNSTLVSGSGVETLIGGAGIDTYVINNAADVIIDSSGKGIFKTSLNEYTMGDDMKNLTVTGAGSHITGNSLDNVTITLSGAGSYLVDTGTGVETLIGGTGKTTFNLNNANDVVKDSTGKIITASNSLYTINKLFDNPATYTATGENQTLTATSNAATLVSAYSNVTMIGGTGKNTFTIHDLTNEVHAQAGAISNTLDLNGSYPDYINGGNKNYFDTNCLHGNANFIVPDNITKVIMPSDYAFTAFQITANDSDVTITGSPIGATFYAGTGNDTFIGIANSAFVSSGGAQRYVGEIHAEDDNFYFQARGCIGDEINGYYTTAEQTGSDMGRDYVTYNADNVVKYTEGGVEKATLYNHRYSYIGTDSSKSILDKIGILETSDGKGGYNIVVDLSQITGKTSTITFQEDPYKSVAGDIINETIKIGNPPNGLVSISGTDNGCWINDTDIAKIIQMEATYATEHNCTISTMAQLESHADLMTAIAGVWHPAGTW